MEYQNAIEEKLRLEAQLKSGANWFFVIATLSVVNSMILLLGGTFNFIVGLGLTQLVTFLAREASMAGKGLAVTLTLLAACVFVLFGVLARQRMQWAFVVGMVLYGLDGLLFVLVQDWLGIGFHGFALYGIYKGMQALGDFKRLEALSATAPPPPTPAGAGTAYQTCLSCGLRNVPGDPYCERCGVALAAS